MTLELLGRLPGQWLQTIAIIPGGMEVQRLKAAPVLASVVHAARGPAEVPQGM